MKTIPFVDLKAQYETIKSDLEPKILKACADAAYILGPDVAEFEAAFAEYVGVSQGIGVATGTDALILALRALDVGPGHEVLVPANTFVATPLAVALAGAKPVPVDIRENDYLINIEHASRRLSPCTKAIIPVHLFGLVADMDAVSDFASRHRLLVIEDAAQAHGARWAGRRAGSFSRASCFSFYPSKNLGAFGDGGMVVTDDVELAERIRALRNYGSREKYVHDFVGMNSRLDTLQAAILSCKLPHLDEWNEKRVAAARRYNELLSGIDGIIPPSHSDNLHGRHVHHLYVARCRDRKRLMCHLTETGIQFGIHYPLPFHLQQAFATQEFRDGSCPVAERVSHEIISLPMFPEITDAQIERVATSVRQFYG